MLLRRSTIRYKSEANQIMTRVGRRLIEDFLLPALNDQRYGDRLQWVDKQNLCFSIRWSHKNAAKWTLEDTVVFQDWDKLKGHFHPEIKGYYMQAKQRFRAALYKLNTVRKIRSQEKHTKVYQLVLSNDKKKLDSPVMRPKLGKDGPCIPTSVICRNVNYVPSKQCVVEHAEQPAVLKAESSEYSHNSLSNDSCSLSNDYLGSDEIKHSPNHVPSVLNFKKEKDTDEVRIQPHVPVQPIPEYSPKFRAIQPLMHRWQNFPCESMANGPSQQIKGENFMEGHVDESMACSEVLNLSVKQKTYHTSCIPVSAKC